MNQPGVTSEKGLIAWFAKNHVAANLLMVMMILAGIWAIRTMPSMP